MTATALAPKTRLTPLSQARSRTRKGSASRAQLQATDRLLLLSYHRYGDLGAREELVWRFLPFARELALRYSYLDEPFEDLLQVACLGLVKAIDRYEPEQGSKFTSYAAPTILGELKRYFRDRGWALRVPRELQERSLAIGYQTELLSKELGRRPLSSEIAKALGCSTAEVREAQQAATSYQATSLDGPTSNDHVSTSRLIDLVGTEDNAYGLIEERGAIATTWSTLSMAERNVLKLRFVLDLTQHEIGERTGYSQMHVSRLLKRGITRLETATATC